MGDLTKEQIKLFGKPRCCEYDMLKIDDFKLHTIVRAVEKLKSNLEKEILKNID